jgi:predicted DNA-binding transcriptional regulator YafY
MKIASRPMLRRLLEIDTQIRGGAHPNSHTLAESLEVSERTIHRDLECMRTELHAPLEFSPARNGFRYSDPGFRMPLMELRESELVALFLAERVLQAYEGGEVAELLRAAFGKLLVGLSATVSVRLEHLAEACSVRTPALSRQEARMFARLIQAIEGRRELELWYWTASRDEQTRRRVDPYHLLLRKGEWYLIGYCHLREEERMFAPARIRRMRETGATFERPADFDVQPYLDSFGAIRGDIPRYTGFTVR